MISVIIIIIGEWEGRGLGRNKRMKITKAIRIIFCFNRLKVQAWSKIAVTTFIYIYWKLK